MTNNGQIKFKKTEIGLIPEDWEVLELNDVCQTISETYNLKNKDEIVFLNTSDIYDGKIINNKPIPAKNLPGQAKKRIQKGDILYSEIRPTNKRYAFIDFDADEYVVSTKLMVLRPNNVIDSKYLFIFLSSPEILNDFQILAETRSGTFPQITFDTIKHKSIPFPSLSEQQKIAGVLGALDDKIELNRKMNKTLESLTQAIFKKLFVDVIDEDSKIIKLGELLHIDRGLSYKGKYLKDSGTPMFNLGSFNIDGSLKLDTLKHYIGDYKENNTVSAGDIIVANTDMTQNRAILGSACLIPDLFSEKILFTHHVYALRIENPVNRAFIFEILKTRDFKDQAIGFATGTTVLFLPKESILNYEIKYPKIEKIKQFNTIFDQVVRKQVLLIKEIDNLSQIRDSLLPRLMSGKLRTK